MVILQLDIQHFGKLKDKKIALRPGMNVITGANEAGKTTIAEFIKAVFYGANEKTVRKYYPLEDDGIFGGMIKVMRDGEFFEIYRYMVPGQESLSVTRTSDRSEVEDPETWVQEAVANLDLFTYEKTGYINMAELLRDSEDYSTPRVKSPEEIREEIIRGRYQKAAETLRVKRAEFEGNTLSDPDAKIVETDAQIETLTTEKARIADEIPGAEEAYNKVVDDLKRDQDRIDRENKDHDAKMREDIKAAKSELANYVDVNMRSQHRKNVLGMMFLIIGMLLGLAVYFYVCSNPFESLEPYTQYITWGGYGLAAAFGLAGLIVTIVTAIKKKFDTKRFEKQEELRNLAEHAESRYQYYLDHKEEMDAKVDHLEARLEKIAELGVVLNGLRSDFEDVDKNIGQLLDKRLELVQASELKQTSLTEMSALDIAIGSFDKLGDPGEDTEARELGELATLYLSKIDTRKNEIVAIAEDGTVSVLDGSKITQLYSLSTGASREVLLALRLASLERLDKEKLVPLVLDDVLANFDSERLNSTMTLLRSLKRQVVLFSCQTRERRQL